MRKYRVHPASGSDLPFLREASASAQQQTRGCDFAGCTAEGLHRAPKSRENLNEHYWFCLPHVQEYNKGWDYFAGMDMDQIERETRRAQVWDRPTWPLGSRAFAGDKLRARIFRGMADGEGPSFTTGFHHNGGEETGRRHRRLDRAEPASAVSEALAVLDLRQPVTLKQIQSRYKDLAKQFHPDRNPGRPEAEERLKLINRAYQILKDAWKAGAAASGVR